MSADDFVVTSSNQEATMWIQQWPQWPSVCSVIHGPSGSGKTHLMHMWLAKSHGKALTSHDLLRNEPGALIMSNRNIAIDDAQQIATNPVAEEALFHLYNALKETGGSLLLTAEKPPAKWPVQLADLRSRLNAAPALGIHAPDDELLTMLLIKQFHDRQIDVGMDVVTYIVPRIERTTQALREVVNKLDQAALSESRGITIALARRLLS
ncbi:MAG: DNA replication protein [Alphaproteobacteria bacterium]|nr:DNA replication protein [Alphaproteobacteria bacterium]